MQPLQPAPLYSQAQKESRYASNYQNAPSKNHYHICINLSISQRNRCPSSSFLNKDTTFLLVISYLAIGLPFGWNPEQSVTDIDSGIDCTSIGWRGRIRKHPDISTAGSLIVFLIDIHIIGESLCLRNISKDQSSLASSESRPIKSFPLSQVTIIGRAITTDIERKVFPARCSSRITTKDILASRSRLR